MKKNELQKYVGKILLKDNKDYKWMFKVIGITPCGDLWVKYGIDIYPKPRAYHSTSYFNLPFQESYIPSIIKFPSKTELNLYRQYTRELRLLGTNKSKYGTK